MNKSKKSVLVALLTVGFIPATSIAQEPVGVQAVTSKAIASNPEVQAAWHEFLAAENARKVARGGYFPNLDLSARAGSEERELVDANTTQEFDHRGVDLTLTQMLWDGLFTRNEVRSRDHVRRTRYFEVRNAAEATALEAFRAFQDVQRYRELVDLAQRNYDSHREVYDQISERVRAGISRSVDLEQVSGRVALAQANLITETSNLHDVSARYERVVGEPPPPRLAPAPSLDKDFPASIGTALDTAYAAHPAINAAHENIRASHYAVSSARSAYSPRLDIRLRAEQGDDINQIQGETNDQIAELVLSYNLFNGGSDRAQVAQRMDEEKTAEYLRDQTCREVRQNLRIAYNDTARLQDQLLHLNVHKLSTEKTREVYRDQFTLGQRTLLDLLDTENEAFDARRAYANAEYDRSIAQARSLASMGQLLAALQISRGDLATAGRGIEAPDSRRQLCPHMGEPAPLVKVAAAPVVLDSDRDGVINDIDLCPGTPPGTPVNEVGCPPKQPVVLHGVNFKLDSADLLPESMIILDKAAKTLVANPKLQVEIAGHTDATGSEAYNLKLSQRRASTVVIYLSQQGVSSDRLRARGYGESRPVTTNKTPEGRAENRRVEFNILNSEK